MDHHSRSLTRSHSSSRFPIDTPETYPHEPSDSTQSSASTSPLQLTQLSLNSFAPSTSRSSSLSLHSSHSRSRSRIDRSCSPPLVYLQRNGSALSHVIDSSCSNTGSPSHVQYPPISYSDVHNTSPSTRSSYSSANPSLFGTPHEASISPLSSFASLGSPFRTRTDPDVQSPLLSQLPLSSPSQSRFPIESPYLRDSFLPPSLSRISSSPAPVPANHTPAPPSTPLQLVPDPVSPTGTSSQWHSWKAWTGFVYDGVEVDVRMDPATKCWALICPCCSVHFKTNYDGSTDMNDGKDRGGSLREHWKGRYNFCSAMEAQRKQSKDVLTSIISTPASADVHTVECPGVPLEACEDFMIAFPWQIYNTLSFVVVTDRRENRYACARTCRGLWHEGSDPCPDCKGIRRRVSQVMDLVRRQHAQGLTAQSMGVARLRDEYDKLDTEASLLYREIEALEKRAVAQTKTIADHRELLATVARVRVPRTAAVLESTFMRGRSIEYTIEKFELAALGKYRPRGYTTYELDLAVIVGSNRVTYALNKSGNLPSRRTVGNYAQKIHVPPQVGAITAADLERNIEVAFLGPRRELFKASGAEEPTKELAHLALDESIIQDNPSLVKLPGEQYAIVGFCVEETPREALILTFDGYPALVSLAEKYRDGTYHLARQVTLAGLVVSGEPGLIPVLAAPTCKSQTNVTAADFIRLFLQVYNDNPELQQYIELTGFSSDGDPARRKAFHQVLYSIPVVPGHSFWLVMSQCGGWNRFVGPNNTTADPDWRHVLEKRVSTCLRTGDGMLVNRNTSVGTGLLGRLLPLVPGTSSSRVAKLLYPHDAMNVPAADELLRLIVSFSKLPDADLQSVADSDWAGVDAMRFLGQLLEAILNIFVNVHCSLSDQLMHASKAAHLMFTMFRTSRTDSMNVELYHDAQSLFHHLPTMVLRQQKLDGSVDVCFATDSGSDDVEDVFGEVHILAGHRKDPDYKQFLEYATTGLQRLQAYRRHPELKPRSDRRTIKTVEDDDYIRKRHWQADLAADTCDIALAWKKGEEAAAEACRLYGKHISPADYDYPALWASPDGIDLQHPFGNGWKPGVSQDVLEPTSDLPSSTNADDEMDSEAGSDDENEGAPGPENEPAAQSDENDEADNEPGAFMDINGKRVHMSTVIKNTVVIHERVDLVSRLEKVKTFTPTTTVRLTELEAEAASSEPANTLSLGDYVLTLVRFKQTLSAAIVKVTLIKHDGASLTTVSLESLAQPQSRLRIHGHILHLRPAPGTGLTAKFRSSLDAEHASIVFHAAAKQGIWSLVAPGDALERTVPFRGRPNMHSQMLCTIDFSGHVARKVFARPVWGISRALPDETLNSRGTLDEFYPNELQPLADEIFASVSTRSSFFRFDTFAILPDSVSRFPYSSYDEDAPALLCAPGTALLAKYAHVKGILRGICLFESCGQAITGSEDAFRAHMGKHELHHKFGTGLHQPKDTDDVQYGPVPPHGYCCFCIGDCVHKIRVRGKDGDHPKFSLESSPCALASQKIPFGRLLGDSNTLPTNIPVICPLCLAKAAKKHYVFEGINKYHMLVHIENCHPEFATPTFPDRRLVLPFAVMTLIFESLKEQAAQGIEEKLRVDPWSFIGRFYDEEGEPLLEVQNK